MTLGQPPMTEELSGPGSGQRPGGIAFLSIILGWLSLAGFGNAWVLATGRIQLPPWLGLLAALYGVTAATASIGLWRLRPWGLRALTAWMATCGLLLICFVGVFPSRLILGGYWGALGFIVAIGSVFVLVDRYVRRRLASPLVAARRH
jgi:hypothetical protein